MAFRKKTKLDSSDLYCAFCRKGAAQVAKLIAGPGVHICDGCVGLCNQILAGEEVWPFPDLNDRSDDELLASLGAGLSSSRSIERSVRTSVRLLRERGLSWERIGAALGTTRQAAWERFSD